eukprot:m.77704 g.77704  ORF g.77704 m.77704 type:complete len:382 (+) comp9156_c1_seq2:818-1963(+)
MDGGGSGGSPRTPTSPSSSSRPLRKGDAYMPRPINSGVRGARAGLLVGGGLLHGAPHGLAVSETDTEGGTSVLLMSSSRSEGAAGSAEEDDALDGARPAHTSPQKRALRRRGHRRSSSAPVFLNKFNNNLAPLSETDEDEVEEPEPPQEDRSLHFLNVCAIKRQRELQRLSPLGRTHITWPGDDRGPTSSPLTMSTSSPLVRGNAVVSPEEGTSDLESESGTSPEEGRGLGNEEDSAAMTGGLGHQGAATPLRNTMSSTEVTWPTAETQRFSQLLAGSVESDESEPPPLDTLSIDSAPPSRRSTISKDFEFPSRRSSSLPLPGCLKTKSYSMENLSKKVMIRTSKGLYRPDSSEGLEDLGRSHSRSKRTPGRRHHSPPPAT